ncbi:MAG: hypothetical protein M0Z95_01405 [Actinomycetota bacterium]|nr:hypothetical protein [Actinomycetota bacterium]
MLGPTISAPEIAALYGIAVNSVYRLHERHPGFPAPLSLGRRRVWRREAVMAHNAAWLRGGAMVLIATPPVLEATVTRSVTSQPGHATSVRPRRRRAAPAPCGARGLRL